LKTLLKSKRLRDDIASVDEAEDRQKALKIMRGKNSEFEGFVSLMMEEVYLPDRTK
jgi:hypothetical protein